MGVLIIDSTGVQAGLISSVLRRGGYEEAIASHPEDGAVARLDADERFDLVVIDLQSLTGDPVEVYGQIRSTFDGEPTPVLLLAEAEELPVVEPVLKQDLTECILKPLNDIELLVRLTANLRLGNEVRRRISCEMKSAEARRKLSDIGDRLKRVTSLDKTTGIPNRRFFDATYGKEWLRAARSNRAMGLVFLRIVPQPDPDPDDPKPGKSFLKEVALAAANAARRPGDLVARYDETDFVALLPSTPLTGAVVVAENIIRRVDELKARLFPRQEIEGPNVQFGVASQVPRVGESMDGLISKAIQSLA